MAMIDQIREIDDLRDRLLRAGEALLETYRAAGGEDMTDHDLQAMAIGAMIDAGVCPECREPAGLVTQCTCGLGNN